MSHNLQGSVTEQINNATKNIDALTTEQILQVINNEDKKVALAVEKEIKHIAMVIDIAVEKIKQGGKLFYVGAGTSGRIGILDASECPPTYGTDPELVQGIIAGGHEALIRAVEGAEDDEEAGKKVIREKQITEKDIIIGISASGSAKFVLGAVRQAKKLGAVTVALCNNNSAVIKPEVDYIICPIVGPEVITGSTRMKAGTSQKLVLNMISTTVMIKLGKVYGNLMVDVQATNQKLVERATRIVMTATGADKETASRFLQMSGNNAKKAIIMINTGLDICEAEKLLKQSDGFITRALSMHIG